MFSRLGIVSIGKSTNMDKNRVSDVSNKFVTLMMETIPLFGGRLEFVPLQRSNRVR